MMRWRRALQISIKTTGRDMREMRRNICGSMLSDVLEAAWHVVGEGLRGEGVRERKEGRDRWCGELDVMDDDYMAAFGHRLLVLFGMRNVCIYMHPGT
jgi:hypothetical protein